MLLKDRDLDSSPRRPLLTVDEYLALERATEERNVYLDGEIYTMASESYAHGIISVSLVVYLGRQLNGTSFSGRTKLTKVRCGPIPKGHRSSSGLYFYPDLLVVCDKPEHHDDFTDILLNPIAIVEVLSPSTEAFDRGEKFERLKAWNPTLREFLLVSQDRPHIEHNRKQDDGTWTSQHVAGLESTVAIPSIGCTLRLADVYDRIVFPSA